MKKSRLSQILPSTPLISTRRLSNRITQLPSAVDLRPHLTPVEDQLNLGSR